MNVFEFKKESLGGNAKTAMLATINSSSIYCDETLCTLRYAAKASRIKNQACLNRDFKKKYIDEFGQECEMNLILAPMLSMTGLKVAENDAELAENNKRLEMTLKQMDDEWKEKLEEAERLKQKEILELERSLICLYENETRAQNCCLINLNEDPSLSEKLIYVIKESGEPILIGSDKERANIYLNHIMIAPVHCQITHMKNEATQATEYFIEQIDECENTSTYLNGEPIEALKQYQLQHGNILVVAGSHFFRFHNPTGVKHSASSMAADKQHVKDYQYAKDEIERCQAEKIEKITRNIQKERELELEQLRLMHQEDLKKMVSVEFLKSPFFI